MVGLDQIPNHWLPELRLKANDDQSHAEIRCGHPHSVVSLMNNERAMTAFFHKTVMYAIEYYSNLHIDYIIILQLWFCFWRCFFVSLASFLSRILDLQDSMNTCFFGIISFWETKNCAYQHLFNNLCMYNLSFSSSKT
jgi:hypothetical protein